MGADGGAQDPRDAAPDRAGQDGRDEPDEDMQRPRCALEVRADPERRDETDPELALPADVEQPAAEGERHGESREDERGGDEQRLLQVAGRLLARLPAHPGEEPVQARALEDGAVGA